jgi:beta-xylosidase
MTASSFNHVPGLPILKSYDLVHWQLIGHALPKLTPIEHFNTVRHGGGVWAPSIRYHNNAFYIYYPDPDFGIYVVTAKNIAGPWSAPVLVEAGKGLIDPCPLWDTDGKNYLVHAYAGSRAGIKSILVIKELDKTATKVISKPTLIYDGHEIDPTIEGPKFYKRGGWYYIFAPAGGVATGWQTVLRSKNIYGPYERRVVMEQGSTAVNGPHQGAWVETPTGESWFLHFQDKEAYGRIVHLQPMVWKNDWPIIGVQPSDAPIGNPVMSYSVPGGKNKFLSESLNQNLLWQWQANPLAHWKMNLNGVDRFYAVTKQDSAQNLWNAPNLYMQKIPADSFVFRVQLNFKPNQVGEKTGLILFGLDYAYLGLEKTTSGNQLIFVRCLGAEKNGKEQKQIIAERVSGSIYLNLTVKAGAIASFGYSADGKSFTSAGEKFVAKPGKWVGAKMGIFCSGERITNDAGFVEMVSSSVN